MCKRARPTFLLAVLMAAAVAAFGESAITENTLRLDEGQTRPSATLDSVAWLTGSWRGTGLGGEVQEIWAAPSGGSMMGGFKHLQGGEPAFYELLLILEEEGSLELRLKHFHPDIKGWEEKDESVSFPLVRVGDGVAYFQGLTYRKVGEDGLEIFLALHRGDTTSEVSFSLERVDI